MKFINPLIILRILSTILFLVTITYLLCLPVAYIYGESPYPFIWSAISSVVTAVLLFCLSGKADINKISYRDSFITVTLSWLLISLMGVLPYKLSGTIPSLLDAFFESASGFSTTGCSIIADVEILPFSILFWRSLTHWVGGIGIIVLVIIIMPSLRVNGYQLFTLESSLKEKIYPKTKGIGFRLLLIYLGLTLMEIFLLNMGEMNLFDSICHSFGTIATGGFSTKNNSLAYYSSYSQYIVLMFMLLAGTSHVIFYYLVKLNFKKARRNEELWFYYAVVLIAGTAASSLLYLNTQKSIEESLREGFFQSVSIITCTGFASADYLLWPATGSLLIFFIMFSGGSTGSTSGGIKIARHLVVLKNIKSALVRLTHPRAVSLIKLNGKTVSERTNISILSFIVLYIFIFIIGTTILVITDIDLVTAASSAATCMAGIGPGLGSVGPMSNYSHLPEISKIVLIMLMIIGRLEILTVFTLFTRSFWSL